LNSPCFEKAKALGGEVAVPKTTIPGMGSFAFVKAPDGNLIGLFETGQ
jgi:predicted enzyme related to lactoylglutathione lyase